MLYRHVVGWIGRIVVDVSVGEDVEGRGELIDQGLPPRGHPLSQYWVIYTLSEMNKPKNS